VGGVLADRWNRKRAIVIGELLMALPLLPVLAVPSRATLPVLYAGVLVIAVMAQVTGPAASAALPLVVGEEQLIAANSAFSAANNVARIVGAALGGALMAGFGLHVVITADALSFLLAGLCVAAIGIPLQKARREEEPGEIGDVWTRTAREWLEGIRLVIHRRWIAVTFLVVGIAVFGDGMFTALAVPFVRHTLHASALVFGWSLTARGIGGLLGTFAVPLIGKKLSPRALVGWSAVTDGIIVCLIAVLANVPALLIFMLLVGTPVVGLYVSIPSLLQKGVEDEVRGRVFGAYGAVAQLMVLLGILFAGAAVSRTGVLFWMYVGGALYVLAGVIALAFLHPEPAAQVAPESRAVTVPIGERDAAQT
jgi:predicted MFS family arabinose efflux permease